jgi:hypothetical protein
MRAADSGKEDRAKWMQIMEIPDEAHAGLAIQTSAGLEMASSHAPS